MDTTTEGLPSSLILRQWMTRKRVVLPVLVASVAFYIVFRHVDVTSVVEMVGRMDARYYGAAFALFYLSVLLRGTRWRVLLANLGLRRSIADATRVLFRSWFVNCIVPAKLGDFYRCYLVRRRFRFSAAQTLGSVAVERTCDLIAVASLMSISGLLLFGSLGAEYLWRLVTWGLLATGVTAAAVISLALKGEGLAQYVPTRWVAPFRAFTVGLAGTWKRLPLVMGITALIWGLETARLFCVTRALDLSVPAWGIIFTALAASLLTALPMTVGGLGAVEGAMVAILVLLKIDQPTATLVALLDRSISYWSIVLFGFLAFLLNPEG